MTDFKVGDKVRYVGSGAASVSHDWIGIEGVVTADKSSFVYVTITKGIPGSKTYTEGFEIWPYKVNLELITEEEPFTFKDIQKGDLIRRTVIRKDGSKVIWEGVADHVNWEKTTWVTEGGNPLWYKSDDTCEGSYTLELLDRPEPPHWAEAKPVGSIFLYNKGVNKAIWKKTSETRWERTFIATNISHIYTINEVKDWITEEQEWIK
jgi:hypothetical protein